MGRSVIFIIAFFFSCSAVSRAEDTGSRGVRDLSPPGKTLPALIDMGPGHYSPGSFVCLAATRDSSFGWVRGAVHDVTTRRRDLDPLFADCVAGQDATFLVAVEPAGAACLLHLYLGSPVSPGGPTSISVDGQVVADSIVTRPGEIRHVTATSFAPEGRIAIRFSAACSEFAIYGVTIEGSAGASLGHLLPPAPAVDAVPPRERLPRLDLGGQCLLLRNLADYLVDSAPPTGGFSPHGAWYQNAYPVRTLMAAGRLLNESRYTDAALACLDAFVARQRPDGNWSSSYDGLLPCNGGSGPGPSSANLADIGAMTAALALAAPLVDGPRRASYLGALQIYATSVSLPNQLPEGAFPNRQWNGRDLFHPYSVATATQTSTLAALYQATCDSLYLDASERGARWLARLAIGPEGDLALSPHDQDTVLVRESTDFGDAFYIADALLAVRRDTRDENLAREIDLALDRWLFGPHGVRSRAVHGYWWKPEDCWSYSKRGGMIYVLAAHPRRHDDPVIDDWLEAALGWMSDPARSRLIGVLSPPADQRGDYALPASGFAGIGVAAAIDPRVLSPGWNLETRLFRK